MRVQRDDYYNLAELKELGWSASMIEELLGKEDLLKSNPIYKSAAPSKWYDKQRVGRAMDKARFKWLRHKSQQRVEARAKGEAARQQERQILDEQHYRAGVATLEQLPIHGPTGLSFKTLKQHACDAYNALQMERGRDSMAHPKDSHEFVERLCVNFLMHAAIVDMDLLEQNCKSSPRLRSSLDELVREKIYGWIVQHYPMLQAACQQKKQWIEKQHQYAEGDIYFPMRLTHTKVMVERDAFSSGQCDSTQFERWMRKISKDALTNTWNKHLTFFATLNPLQQELVLTSMNAVPDEPWHALMQLSQLDDDTWLAVAQDMIDNNKWGRAHQIVLHCHLSNTLPFVLTPGIEARWFEQFMPSKLNDSDVLQLVEFVGLGKRSDLLASFDIPSIDRATEQSCVGYISNCLLGMDQHTRQSFLRWMDGKLTHSFHEKLKQSLANTMDKRKKNFLLDHMLLDQAIHFLPEEDFVSFVKEIDEHKAEQQWKQVAGLWARYQNHILQRAVDGGEQAGGRKRVM